MTATFFLSTGRCGTQAITKYLKDILKDSLVCHEPAGPYYYPRITLNEFDINRKELDRAKKHFDEVLKNLDSGKNFVEVGWPCFTWLEKYYNALKNRFRYIHLIRNPFCVAASLTTHNFYEFNHKKEPINYYFKYAALHPTDPGVSFPEIKEYWNNLNNFDKCLFQWLEINSFSKKLKSKNILPIMTVKHEDLFFDQKTKNEFTSIFDQEDYKKINFFDNYHLTSKETSLKPSCDYLLNKVIELAIEFGYTEEFLQESLKKINYTKKRK